ncbi:hypothetical protein SR870_08555 [Rhodopseudomonas palustris]|uniref:hypothetical protein n=1 Tax=Rhodopseudomonas palustris TaxID=1076 RepID=UPI002ACD9751|nr:hypothetical protein [Rhodopseudomonas palustris]WQH01309.1 hypothetical protein SR870_08555 [Rhodopseudomonas palustris]
MLHVDVPTRQEITTLNRRRSEACVSIYLATTPLTQNIAISRTEFGNLSEQAFAQLEEIGFDKRRLSRPLLDER